MPNIHLSVIDRKYVRSATFGQLVNDTTAIIQLLRELLDDPKCERPIRIRDRMDLIRIALQDNLRLVVARDIDINSQDHPNIVGMASVHWIELPTEITAYVDDVVVLGTYRKQKIGLKLMQELIRIAKYVCAECLDLTSGPQRIKANELYVGLGFEKKDTNYYRLKL